MVFTIIDPAITPIVAAFLFVFAVVYAILTTAKIFESAKKVNAVIAAVFGFFSVMYEPFVIALQQYLPLAAAFLIIIFFIVLLKKIFGKKEGQSSSMDLLPFVVALAIFLILINSLSGSFFVAGFLSQFGIDPVDALFLVGLITILLIFVAVYYHRGWPAPR